MEVNLAGKSGCKLMDSLYIQWEYGLVPRLLLLVINLVGAIFTDPALGWLSTLDERTSEH